MGRISREVASSLVILEKTAMTTPKRGENANAAMPGQNN